MCCWNDLCLAQLQERRLRSPQQRLPLSISQLWNPEYQMEIEIKSSNNLGWKGPQDVFWSKPSQGGADFVVKCNSEVSCSCLGAFSRRILSSSKDGDFTATRSSAWHPFCKRWFFFAWYLIAISPLPSHNLGPVPSCPFLSSEKSPSLFPCTWCAPLAATPWLCWSCMPFRLPARQRMMKV